MGLMPPRGLAGETGMVLTGEGKAVVLEVSVLPSEGKEPLPRKPGEKGECVLPLV